MPRLLVELKSIPQCLLSIRISLLPPVNLTEIDQCSAAIGLDLNRALQRDLGAIPLAQIHVSDTEQKLRFKKVGVSRDRLLEKPNRLFVILLRQRRSPVTKRLASRSEEHTSEL